MALLHIRNNFFIVVLCHFTVWLLEEVLNFYYDMFCVKLITPKDLWNVNKFYSSLNYQNFFAAVLNNIILEDDCGNLYISLPVQLAWDLRATIHKGLQNCLSS